MKSFTDTFHERVGRAAEAKQKALDNLRSRPPVDEKVLAERQAARLAREAAEAERRVQKKAAQEAEREAARAAKAADEAAKLAAQPVPLTEAEKKLARDARYAARKNRKQAPGNSR